MAEEIINVGNSTVTFKRGIGSPGKVKLVECGDLWDAFTNAERNAIAGSAKQAVKAFLWTLAIRTSLKRGEVRNMLDKLEADAMIDAGRAADIANALR